jgi:hypothetical protein
VPNLAGMVRPPPQGGSSEGVIGLGDGTVPFFSAKPPDALLTNPLSERSHGFPGVVHADMASSAQVIARLKRDIADLVGDWWRT